MNINIIFDVVWAFIIIYGALVIYPNEIGEKGFWKWFGLWCILGGVAYFLLRLLYQ